MRCVLFFIVFFNAGVSSAQVNQPVKLKIFLDCRINCDENYIRTEINFVDFVTSRTAADVHIMINSQVNGSGGYNVVLTFYGQNSFSNQVNTLLYIQPPTATNNELRIQIVKRIRLGLLLFLKKMQAEKISIQQPGLIKADIPAIEKKMNDSLEPSSTKDLWNYWVYKVGADGNYNADENYRSNSMNAYFIVNRTTDKLRVNFSAYTNTNNTTYSYENNGILSDYKVKNTSYQLNHYLVKSISSHWSLGYEASYSNSTFSNNKSRKYAGTAIEYSVFPYKEVNNKFFTISYSINARQNKYYDTTIYNKISEILFSHKLQVNLSLNQKWGYVNTGIAYSNYFKDWKLNNLLLNLDINVRVTGGLSCYLYCNAGLVHDQIYLVKGNATLQEILTRKRQLASGYNFYSGLGISYRFGSILNNFVNPRIANF